MNKTETDFKKPDNFNNSKTNNMRMLTLLVLFITTFSFAQTELINNTSVQIDTVRYQGIKNSIKDQTYFININPSAEKYFKRAQLKTQIGNYKGAIEDYDLAAKMTPNEIAIYYNRAAAKERINDLEGAYNDFTKTIESVPNNEWGWHDRALIEIKQKKYNEAEKDLEKALSLKPNWEIAIFSKGLLYQEQQDFDKAILFYTESLALNPNNYLALNNLGFIYFNQKKYDLAISKYSEAIVINLNYFNAYRNRADAKIAKKDFKGACQDLNIASGLGDKKAEKILNDVCKKK